MTNTQPFFQLSSLGLEASSTQILQSWLSAMQTQYPGYSPSAGSLEYIQAQIFSTFMADLASLCSQGANALFEQFGTQLLQLPVQIGTPAVASVTITATDSSGYTLPGGSQLTLTLSGVQLGFQTATALVIANGETSGTVLVNAVQPGLAFNGAAAPAELLAQVNWVSGVAVNAPATGGVDPEDPDHYLARLRQTLTTLAPRPITADNFATMALDFVPAPGTDQQEVGRATAIDGYDPDSNTFNNEREVTVCVTDTEGQPLDSDTLAALQAWFASQREISFIPNVVSPNYSSVYVTVTVVGAPGWDAATVQASVQSALLAYLTPANFGLPAGAIVGWQNYTSVYRSKINSVIQTAGGVDHVVTGTLAMDISANPTNTTNDLSLPGPFPLPVSSTDSIPLTAITVI